MIYKLSPPNNLTWEQHKYTEAFFNELYSRLSGQQGWDYMNFVSGWGLWDFHQDTEWMCTIDIQVVIPDDEDEENKEETIEYVNVSINEKVNVKSPDVDYLVNTLFKIYELKLTPFSEEI